MEEDQVVHKVALDQEEGGDHRDVQVVHCNVAEKVLPRTKASAKQKHPEQRGSWSRTWEAGAKFCLDSSLQVCRQAHCEDDLGDHEHDEQ